MRELSQFDLPHEAWHRLRARNPVCWSPRRKAWLLTRYRDVAALFRDPRLAVLKPSVGRPAGAPSDPAARRALQHRTGAYDELLRKRLVPSTVAALEPFVRREVRRLLEAGVEDWMDALALPLPFLVMAELLGLDPVPDPAPLRALFDDVTAGVDMDVSPRAAARRDLALVTLARHLEPRLGSRGLGAELAARGQERRVLMHYVVMLLYAGTTTTKGLLGNALVGLARHPELWRELAGNPGRIPEAVEEFLRWDGPVQGVGRVALEEIPVGDAVLRPGDGVYLMTGAANRDPEVFPDPDRLCLGRPGPHLAFAVGSTYCLGAGLARLEARVVLEEFLARHPEPRGLAALEWAPHRLVREPRRLELENPLGRSR